jgi:hypothetical protein
LTLELCASGLHLGPRAPVEDAIVDGAGESPVVASNAPPEAEEEEPAPVT